MPHKLIDLKKLARTKARAIERMTETVERASDELWTAETRPTTRGGKCWVTSAEDGKDSQE